AMAQAGGGAAFPADQGAALADRIAAARTARLAQDPQAGSSFRDFGPWLVPLAMAAAFPLFRRRR
ncbi:MAG: VWA domain-containing protein, partial [Paracoccaceae bacterium]